MACRSSWTSSMVHKTELDLVIRGLETSNAEMMSKDSEMERIESEKPRLLKDMEKQLASSKAERDDISRDLGDAQEKLKLQSNELKDALQQRKVAMSEYTEITDMLSELQQQKQKLSRKVRDKEEELKNSLPKIDNLRQDIIKAEKLRRELEFRTEEACAETNKERQLREKAEAHAKNLDIEGERLRSIKLEKMELSGMGEKFNDSKEVVSLKAEIERLEVAHGEALLAEKQKYSQKRVALQERMADADTERMALETVLTTARDRLEKARINNLQDNEDVVSQLRASHEKEKNLLLEKNDQLSGEIERSLEISTRLQSDRRKIDEGYAELQVKTESVAQWEAQIAEILKFVSDEKDARAYLQALAGKMTEELDFLKVSGGSNVAGKIPPLKNWRNRRCRKPEKMELLNLQSNLQSEIQAKQAINEELSKARAEMESTKKKMREYKVRVESYSREMLRKECQIKELQLRIENGDGCKATRDCQNSTTPVETLFISPPTDPPLLSLDVIRTRKRHQDVNQRLQAGNVRQWEKSLNKTLLENPKEKNQDFGQGIVKNGSRMTQKAASFESSDLPPCAVVGSPSYSQITKRDKKSSASSRDERRNREVLMVQETVPEFDILQ